MSTTLSRRRLLAGLTTAGAISLSGCMNAITDEPDYSYDLADGIEGGIESVDFHPLGVNGSAVITAPARGEYWLRASGLVNGVSESADIEVEYLYENEPTEVDFSLGVSPRALDTIHLTVEPYTDQPTSTNRFPSDGGA